MQTEHLSAYLFFSNKLTLVEEKVVIKCTLLTCVFNIFGVQFFYEAHKVPQEARPQNKAIKPSERSGSTND